MVFLGQRLRMYSLDPDIQQRMILGVGEGLALVTAAAALVGRLQADAVNLESLEDKVEDLLHPAPGLSFAGTHGVGVSAAEFGMGADDFVESPTVDTKTRIDTNALMVCVTQSAFRRAYHARV